jgi:hypothetical protein
LFLIQSFKVEMKDENEEILGNILHSLTKFLSFYSVIFCFVLKRMNNLSSVCHVSFSICITEFIILCLYIFQFIFEIIFYDSFSCASQLLFSKLFLNDSLGTKFYSQNVQYLLKLLLLVLSIEICWKLLFIFFCSRVAFQWKKVWFFF